MQKIPSVFLRNPENMSELTHEVDPRAQWVIDGEGVATRKYDGTCVMFDGEKWWARREVKFDKLEPPNWLELDVDPITGKRMGWEPIEQSGLKKHLQDALDAAAREKPDASPWSSDTYELCGPKVNKNPEGFEHHVLVKHELAEVLGEVNPDAFGALSRAFTESDVDLRFRAVAVTFAGMGISLGWEGLVWHHPDGRMAKLKVRDFR